MFYCDNELTREEKFEMQELDKFYKKMSKVELMQQFGKLDDETRELYKECSKNGRSVRESERYLDGCRKINSKRYFVNKYLNIKNNCS